MASNNNQSSDEINMFHKHRNNLEEDDPEEHRADDVTGWWEWISDGWNALSPFVQALNNKPTDDERLERIFNQLDRKGNGRIDIHDLSASLKALGISDKYAAVSIRNNYNLIGRLL